MKSFLYRRLLPVLAVTLTICLANIAGPGRAADPSPEEWQAIGQLIGAAANAAAQAEQNRQQQQQQQGGGDQGWDDGNGDYYDPNQQQGQPSQQFIQQPVAPAAPARPRPEQIGPTAVREIPSNRLLPPAARPTAAVRTALTKALDGVLTLRMDTIMGVLKTCGISDLASRAAIKDARERGDLSESDLDTLKDLESAYRRGVVDDVVSLSESLGFDDEDHETLVLSVMSNQLHKTLDDAAGANDNAALLAVQKLVKKFQKELRSADNIPLPLRNGLKDQLDGIVAVLEAREEMHEAAEESKTAAAGALNWPTGEVWVLSTTALKPGTVLYVTTDMVAAGTAIKGEITLVKSTVAAAFGIRSFANTLPVVVADNVLAAPSAVTFVNPGKNKRPIRFKINGYDYSLEAGQMIEFITSSTSKLEDIKYATVDGQAENVWFKLTENSGDPLPPTYFVFTNNGTAWSLARRNSLPLLRGAAVSGGEDSTATYISNETPAAISITFNGQQTDLPSGFGQRFDNVTNWRLDFTSAGVPKANTLAGGRSFRFVTPANASNPDEIEMRSAPPVEFVVDNSGSASPFSYLLGSENVTIPAGGSKTHKFAVPKSSLVTYDSGTGSILSQPLPDKGRLLVGVDPSLRLGLHAEEEEAVANVDASRKAALDADTELLAQAEKEGDHRKTEREQGGRPSRGKGKGKGRRPKNPSDVADNNSSTDNGSGSPVEPAADETDPSEQPEPGAPRPRPKRNPAAHLLAVGISKYKNEKYNLKFADKDATEFASVFAENTKQFFSESTNRLLVNEKATRDSIAEELDALTNSVDDGDLVVMFFSAHGMSDGSRFYLCTHDVDPTKLISTSIKYSDIIDATKTLSAKKCKVLLLADTCNSGALGEGLGAKSVTDRGLFQAHKDFASAGSGCVLLASSADGQASFERPEWGHGAFTKALLDAIADPETDGDEDGFVYLGELEAAASKRLRKMTGGKQRMPKDWPSNVLDFPLMQTGK